MKIKERPILFKGEMARAILSRQKTQTRRALKLLEGWQFARLEGSVAHVNKPGFHGEAHEKCPYGEPGDRLWVRETHARAGCKENCDHLSCHTIYRADKPKSAGMYGCVKWTPSIFMPRWASRITLEITDVRVERLNQISNQDAVAEGIGQPTDIRYAAEDGFKPLWESINGPNSFDDRWVWVINFELVTNS